MSAAGRITLLRLPGLPPKHPPDVVRSGAIAQLGERLHGMQEVRGSIPLGSTIATGGEDSSDCSFLFLAFQLGKSFTLRAGPGPNASEI